MKSFSIKLGKAFRTLQNDGLWKGSKRIFGALQTQQEMRGVKRGDILLISGGVGESARYRTRYVAEELNHNGFQASATIQDNRQLSKLAESFSVFVFHRVLVTQAIEAFIEKLKMLKKEMIFETDDLTYDPAFLEHMHGFTRMNGLERELYKNGLGGEILNDPAVTVATTTTSYLCEKLKEKNKKVFLVSNKMSEADRLLAQKILASRIEKDPGVVRIGYLSGSASHDRDFAVITPVLLELLEAHSEVRLVCVGPLHIDPRFAPLADRIEKLSFVSWDEHFRILAGLDINLAPLEVGNPFCEGKSEIKFSEAGIVGVPTVASATQTYREAIHDGEDGFVALSAVEWREKLEKLILDPSFRVAMGNQARKTALERYTTRSGKSIEYYKYLAEKIKK